MIARAVPLAVLSCAIGVLPAHAQVREAAPTAAGTGAIAGTVIADADPPRPVRRAVVTLNGSTPLVARTVVTDDAGRFAFTNLAPGRYSLGASKRGWAAGSYGAKAIGRPGRALQLGAGERATIAIKIAPGAVITGTILDQFGQPINGLSVRVMKYGYALNTGERRLIPTFGSSPTSNERGVYRLYGLSPGEYYISASSSNVGFGGRDLHLTSDIDVEEALKAATAGSGGPIVDVPQASVSFAQVFYPGVTSVAQATPIVVRAGEERAGVDFTIQYSTVARVEGTVLSPNGTPTAARVTLVPSDPNNPASGFESLRNAQAGPDGRFAFAEIMPGPYVMSAQTTLPPAAPGDTPQVFNAVSDLDVQSNMTGLSVMLQEGLTISGTVRYDGTAPPPNLASVRISVVAAQSGVVTVSTGGSTTATDGHFALPGVAAGRYRLSVGQPPSSQPQWTIRSISVLGQDALDGYADVRQFTNDAVITLTDRIAELTGKVEAGSGRTPDYTMILFSTDRAQWRAPSRRVTTARTVSDGSFTFRNVPPGEYYLAPVDDVEPGEWFDPAFLQRLVPAAMTLTIAEGEKKVQDVRVGGR